MNPAVTAIYVTYNSEDTIADTLEAARGGYDCGLLRCVAVDNASSDNTCAIIKERFPWVRLIESAENLGYGRGLNLGFESGVATPYVLYMNPDAVIEPAAIQQLVAFMETHTSAGLAAPAILRRNGAYQVADGMPTPSVLIRQAMGGQEPSRRTIEPDGEPFRTDWICGAIMFARKAMIDEIGGFDPRFFLYFEETDLCRRALDAGWTIWAVGAAQARHASNSSARKLRPGLATGGCLTEYYYPSRFYYLVKHHGWLPAIATEMVELTARAARDVARFLTRRPSRQELRRRFEAPVFTLPAKVG